MSKPLITGQFRRRHHFERMASALLTLEPFRSDTTRTISMKGGESIMMKAMFAMLALVLGLAFGGATFVQADEMKKEAPAAEKKVEKKEEKKEEKKAEKKK